MKHTPARMRTLGRMRFRTWLPPVLGLWLAGCSAPRPERGETAAPPPPPATKAVIPLASAPGPGPAPPGGL